MRSELGERIFQKIGEDGALTQFRDALYRISITVGGLQWRQVLGNEKKLRRMLTDDWGDVLACVGVLGLEPNPDAVGGKLISWAKALGIEVDDEGIKGPPGAPGVDPQGERET